MHRVTCAVDCGLAINPDIVRQQMEGGIIFGLTAALHGEVRIENGRALESNFHDYRMITLADAPAIDVHIVESQADPGGIGEPGTPPIAPAVANAGSTIVGAAPAATRNEALCQAATNISGRLNSSASAPR